MTHALAALCLLACLAGCATSPPKEHADPIPPDLQDPTPELPAATNRPETLALTTDTYDPWERFNRGVYRFNARFDEAIHLPVARAYQRTVPLPIRTAVGNFFSNLDDVGNAVNHLLQGEFAFGARNAGRFLINATVGMAGVFDVASAMGLEHTPTHFGNTLADWGVQPGPYLVLPVLGPSTLRDGLGQAADFSMVRGLDVGGLYSNAASLPMGTVYAIDKRANIRFRYYQTGSPFEYDLVRFLYTRKRAIETRSEANPLPSALPTEPSSAPAESDAIQDGAAQ